MTSIRKPLSVLNPADLSKRSLGSKNIKSFQEKSSKPVSESSDKPQKCQKGITLQIYEDPPKDICQNCRLSRGQRSNQAVQCDSFTPSEDVTQWLTSDKPPEGYWKELAEQRRLALSETLDENRQLCDMIEKLNAELDRLRLIETRVTKFTESLQTTSEEPST